LYFLFVEKKIKDIIVELKEIQLMEAHYERLLGTKEENEKRLVEISKLIDQRKEQFKKLSQDNIQSFYLKAIGRLNEKISFDRSHFKHREKEYVKVLKEIRLQIELEKELKEAIKDGFIVLKEYETTIKFLNARATQFKKSRSYLEENYKKINIDEVENYHSNIVMINHKFLKFMCEVNDVYLVMIKNKKIPKSVLSKFTNHYRQSLFKDLRKAKDFESSLQFLEKYEEITSALNDSFIQDLGLLKNGIEELEEEEERLLKVL